MANTPPTDVAPGPAKQTPPINVALRLYNVRAKLPLSIDYQSDAVVVDAKGQAMNVMFKTVDNGNAQVQCYRMFVPTSDKYMVVSDDGITLGAKKAATPVTLVVGNTTINGNQWLIKSADGTQALTLDDASPQIKFSGVTAAQSQLWEVLLLY